MGPINLTKSEREKKVRAILRLASAIPQRVTADEPDPTLASDLRGSLTNFPLQTDSARKAELDTQGTQLWNLSAQLCRDDVTSSRLRLTLCLLRIFAFYMLDSGHSERAGSTAQRVRLLKVALQAGKICLGNEELDLGVKVVERASHYVTLLSQDDSGLAPEDAPTLTRLTGEYYVLRISMAWKHNNLDVAEHMFNQLRPTRLTLDGDGIEKLADTLYEIGRNLALQRQNSLAVRWLERALDAFPDDEDLVLSDNVAELRLSVLHALVKSLLAQNIPESKTKAKDLIDTMDEGHRDKMVMWLLKLELLASENDPDPQLYLNGMSFMSNMIRSVTLTRPNFKTLMHHIHKLKKISAEAASRCLEELLECRLFAISDGEEWVARATVMRLWVGTDMDPPTSIPVLKDFLNTVHSNVQRPLNASATVAAQTLLWKQVELAFERKEYEQCEGWCRLALHPLFENSGDFNRAKIARKLIMCALARQDFHAAREVFFLISESGRDAATTRYLMYKVALRDGDANLAAECLDVVCRQSSQDATFLYACVLEAQKFDNKRQTVAVLLKILEKYHHTLPEGLHLPALLRCTIRLIRSEMNDLSDEDINTATSELCKLFHRAIAEAKRAKAEANADSSSSFTRTEIDWFSRNSYNLAIEVCTKVNPLYLTQLTTSCTQFIDLLLAEPPVDPPEELHKVHHRRVNCEFVNVCAFTVLGRTEDQRDLSLQHYLSVRHHASNCRTQISALLGTIPADTSNDTVHNDLISKYTSCLTYELEAALHQQAWADLSPLLAACHDYEPASASKWATLADLAITLCETLARDPALSQAARTAHAKPVLAFLEDVIKRSWSSARDVAALARWIRCLFQLALPHDEALALACVDQARRAAEAHGDAAAELAFPPLELEWLATTAFNRGVDLFCVHDEEKARRWAEKAMMLAGCANDGGRLLAYLQKAMKAWTWEEDGEDGAKL